MSLPAARPPSLSAGEKAAGRARAEGTGTAGRPQAAGKFTRTRPLRLSLSLSLSLPPSPSLYLNRALGRGLLPRRPRPGIATACSRCGSQRLALRALCRGRTRGQVSLWRKRTRERRKGRRGAATRKLDQSRRWARRGSIVNWWPAAVGAGPGEASRLPPLLSSTLSRPPGPAHRPRPRRPESDFQSLALHEEAEVRPAALGPPAASALAPAAAAAAAALSQG